MSAMLSGPDFLLLCDGPIFFHFQRIVVSVHFAVSCTHICARPFFCNFVCDQFSSIFVSDKFSHFLVDTSFSIIIECLLRVLLQGTMVFPASMVHGAIGFQILFGVTCRRNLRSRSPWTMVRAQPRLLGTQQGLPGTQTHTARSDGRCFRQAQLEAWLQAWLRAWLAQRCQTGLLKVFGLNGWHQNAHFTRKGFES